MKPRRKKQHFGLLPMFTLVLFIALWVHMAFVAFVLFALTELGIITIVNQAVSDAGKLALVISVASLPISMIVALLFSKVPLKPIRDLIDRMDRLASGDFDARVHVGPIMRRYPAFVVMANSFNAMAEHLGNTELLRSDFINNFSHEFKTPIVSIAGFAKLLRRGNLTAEQQQEYLAVIEEESIRLSDMATNVLNLSKVENQAMLTDVSRFNLSEQIRSCILLLERKWAKKDLDFNLLLEEHTIDANEELLKQVWINLLDNAVKFSPRQGLIEVKITEDSHTLRVSVRNTGSTIPEEKQGRIFDKFYQADESHATAGNGVGLAIVRRIVELHSGSVSVHCEPDSTAFTVILPKQTS